MRFSSLRARDPLDGPLPREVVAELALAPPEQLRQLARALRRQWNRSNWRQRMAYRNCSISRALRLCQRAIGASYDGRERGADGSWKLFARIDSDRVAAVTLRAPKLAAFDDFQRTMTIDVHAPEVFDIAHLRALLFPAVGASQRGKTNRARECARVERERR